MDPIHGINYSVVTNYILVAYLSGRSHFLRPATDPYTSATLEVLHDSVN